MSSELFNLKGRIALVTGSSRGLGKAMAQGLGEAGAVVVLNSRGHDELENTVTSFKAKGIGCNGYAFDVSDEKAVKDNIEKIESQVGPIHILVNNAGINFRGSVEDYKSENWQRLMATNLDAVYYVSQAVGKHMIERKEGKIINTASIASEISRPRIVPYSASKGAVKMLTKGLAVEWGKHNIQVNAIGPGFFRTEMNEELVQDKEFNSWVCDTAPAGRWGEPDELVGTAVFLASAASDYVTGQIIYVDGGWLCKY